MDSFIDCSLRLLSDFDFPDSTSFTITKLSTLTKDVSSQGNWKLSSCSAMQALYQYECADSLKTDSSCAHSLFHLLL